MITLPEPKQGPLRALGLRLAVAIGLVLFVVFVVYLDREGYRDVNEDGISLLDCFYYTVVSLSTTGYGDITPAPGLSSSSTMSIRGGAEVEMPSSRPALAEETTT